jgi:hypothetical protein
MFIDTIGQPNISANSIADTLLPPAPSNAPVIGWSDAQAVHLNLGKLLATKLLIQAASGGGKSWALRRILEQTYGMVQHIVIDPEGELLTLAEKYDYLVCAPEGGDVAISFDKGAEVADAIFKSGRSAILSLGEFESEEMQLFFADFATAIMHMPKETWHHMIIAVDEAHLFAPQHDKAHSKKAMIDLAGRGRKRGIGLVCATLRLSQFHKGVVAHLENKLIGLTTLPLDIERAADQLGLRAADAQKMLPKLQTGEFIAYGPCLTYDLKKVLIGPVNTHHGQLGQFSAVAPVPSMSREALIETIRAVVSPASEDDPDPDLTSSESDAQTFSSFGNSVTEWFPGAVIPAHTGLYEVETYASSFDVTGLYTDATDWFQDAACTIEIPVGMFVLRWRGMQSQCANLLVSHELH